VGDPGAQRGDRRRQRAAIQTPPHAAAGYASRRERASI
jgi:hypothetical protein